MRAARRLAWVLSWMVVAGCGRGAEVPAATAPSPPASTPAPTLHANEPGGRSLELRLDDATLGYLALGELVEPVALRALLPPSFAPSSWYSVHASAGERSYHLEDPARSLPGAVPWLRSADAGFEVAFLRPSEPGLPDHIRKLAATPVSRFARAAVVHVRTAKPEFEEAERFLLVATLDGWSHGVADSALAALPAMTDPERPDKEGNWRSLEALLASLPGPDTTGAEVVVIAGDGEPLVLAPELRATHTVLLKRNLKGRVKLRVYPPGEGKRRAVHDVGDVLQVRVRAVDGQPAAAAPASP